MGKQSRWVGRQLLTGGGAPERQACLVSAGDAGVSYVHPPPPVEYTGREEERQASPEAPDRSSHSRGYFQNPDHPT